MKWCNLSPDSLGSYNLSLYIYAYRGRDRSTCDSAVKYLVPINGSKRTVRLWIGNFLSKLATNRPLLQPNRIFFENITIIISLIFDEVYQRTATTLRT